MGKLTEHAKHKRDGLLVPGCQQCRVRAALIIPSSENRQLAEEGQWVS